jgi:putative chitinase
MGQFKGERMITKEQLSQCMPNCKEPEMWANLLNIHMPAYKLDDKEQLARFIAQCGHESGDFNTLQENLNYSGERLMLVFPKYFKNLLDTEMVKYSRNPEKIANRVYASRMGNGNEQSGDGWKYRGRGIIQLTGKENYSKCSAFLFNSDILVKTPDLVIQPENALLSAIWYWKSNKLDSIESYERVTRRINGGTHGAADRNGRLARARKALG